MNELKTAPFKARERTRHKRSSAGFTLIELMVVIAIIAGLATLVGVNLFGALEDADLTNAKAQISMFKTALMSYRIAFRKFPTTEEGLSALITNSKGKSYLDAKTVPLDPWGNAFVYTSENGRDFVVKSYGADGAPGGSGDGADISSEDLKGGEE